jgi:hypothetical protein
LFVCIDEQYDDALALLEDPTHTVAHPVDIKEFKQAQQTQGFGTLLSGAGAILLALLILAGILLAIGLRR